MVPDVGAMTTGNKMNTTEIPAHVQKLANIVARKAGYHSATAVICSTTGPDVPRVTKRIQCGYRKTTTGEYVPNKYRNNFGWKNTYYQHAVTVVTVPVEFWQG